MQNIIELDESRANPYYIKAFFDSEQGIAALKSITVGATIPNIGVDKLKNVMIPLPSMEKPPFFMFCPAVSYRFSFVAQIGARQS